MNDNRIMIMLDAVIDTRYGTLRQHWPDRYADIIKDGYHDRQWDGWSHLGVSNEDFKEAYAKRSVETLRLSQIAYISPMLNDAANAVEDAAAQVAITTPMAVVINTYPYKDLSKEESVLIARALYTIIGKRVEVTLTYVPYEEMTMTSLKKSYGVLMIYDLNDWLLSQADNMEKQNMPAVQVVAPALYIKEHGIPENTEYKDAAFVDTERSMAQYFRLCLQNVRNFSFVVVPK